MIHTPEYVYAVAWDVCVWFWGQRFYAFQRAWQITGAQKANPPPPHTSIILWLLFVITKR